MLNRKKFTKKKNHYKEFTEKNRRYEEISKYVQDEEYEKALDLLVDFIIDYPDDYYGRFDYALCLIRTGQPKTGILELEILRKKHKKRPYPIYKILIEFYMRNSMFERAEMLLDEADKILPNFEAKYLRIKYYYTVGRSSDAGLLLENLSPKSEREKAVLNILKIFFHGNEYLRKNKREIEYIIESYLRKLYISYDVACKVYLRLYMACSDYEKAYQYIVTDSSKGVKPLLISYEICETLGKKYEAQKYLNMINNYELPENSKIVKIQVLYINGKKEEAFEMCKEYAKDDLEIACLLIEYGIKLNKISEVIDILEGILKGVMITNNKTINLIERLIGLYIYEEKYEEGYKMLQEYDSYFEDISKEEYYIYLSKKLNIWYSPNMNINTYKIRQLREYNYDRAIHHIEKHKHEDNTKYAHTVFNDDLTGRDIMEIIRPHLTKENLYELGPIEKYEVDCTNLNINEKKLIVGKITNTDDIVFCYPSKRVLFELEKEEDYEPKVNQLSPMTKFKNKYNI